MWFLTMRRSMGPAIALPLVAMVATCWLCGAGAAFSQTRVNPQPQPLTAALDAVPAPSAPTASGQDALLVDGEKKLAVLLMASPRDCYAFSTRYYAENDAERLTTYSAFDFSLFGGDLGPGDERTVKIRLVVTPLDADFTQPLKLYEEFLSETDGPSGSARGGQPHFRGEPTP